MRLERGRLRVVEDAEGVGADGLVLVRHLGTAHGASHTRAVRAASLESPVTTARHAVTPRSSSASFIDRRA
ncbi:hypothetical protein SFUMM280S_08545 [Streptomyces fumanus]